MCTRTSLAPMRRTDSRPKKRSLSTLTSISPGEDLMAAQIFAFLRHLSTLRLSPSPSHVTENHTAAHSNVSLNRSVASVVRDESLFSSDSTAKSLDCILPPRTPRHHPCLSAFYQLQFSVTLRSGAPQREALRLLPERLSDSNPFQITP